MLRSPAGHSDGQRERSGLLGDLGLRPGDRRHQRPARELRRLRGEQHRPARRRRLERRADRHLGPALLPAGPPPGRGGPLPPLLRRCDRHSGRGRRRPCHGTLVRPGHLRRRGHRLQPRLHRPGDGPAARGDLMRLGRRPGSIRLRHPAGRPELQFLTRPSERRHEHLHRRPERASSSSTRQAP